MRMARPPGSTGPCKGLPPCMEGFAKRLDRCGFQVARHVEPARAICRGPASADPHIWPLHMHCSFAYVLPSWAAVRSGMQGWPCRRLHGRIGGLWLRVAWMRWGRHWWCTPGVAVHRHLGLVLRGMGDRCIFSDVCVPVSVSVCVLWKRVIMVSLPMLPVLSLVMPLGRPTKRGWPLNSVYN